MPETKDNTVEYDNWSILDRPTDFDQVLGQDAIVKALKREQKDGRWSKSYLFQGNFGSGKTTLAKIIAMNLACKNKDEHNRPCGTCPSCLAVKNETWDRDVVYINGTDMSAEDVRRLLDGFKMTGAFRDAAKVLICDETQDLSPEATNTLLQITESPRKGQFFILTAMDKLKGKLAGALESRCERWKMKVPKVQDIYLYLVEIAKAHHINEEFTDQAAFDLFMKEGLELIAQNCDYSYRRAIMMIQQCVKGRLFTKEEIKDTLDLELEEDMIRTITELANGQITPTVIATITGKEYQNSFGLISKIVGDAAVYKACGTLGYEAEERWKEQGARNLAAAEHFSAVKDTMIKIATQTSGYLPRGLWEMEMSNLVEAVSKKGPVGLREEKTETSPRRRPVK
jgi:DNA polymerase III subunit gamma/tau